MTDETVRIEVTLPGPIDDVWPAFRDPDLIRRWHGWDDDDLDAEIRLIFTDGTIASRTTARCTSAVTGSRSRSAGAQTIVRVTRATPLDSDDDGLGRLVRRHRRGLAAVPPAAALRPDPPLGRRAPHRAPRRRDAVVVTDRGRRRRSGWATQRALAAGEPYAADVAGEQLAGEVWFRSAHQLGLTVDAWGPGLLLLAEAPNAPVAHGAATATLTTYGDDDDGRRAARWRALWAAHYGDGAS